MGNNAFKRKHRMNFGSRERLDATLCTIVHNITFSIVNAL